MANLACSMSNNEEGVKMVRMAAGQIESLCPQVINAARVLAARPKSKVFAMCFLTECISVYPVVGGINIKTICGLWFYFQMVPP